MAIYRNIITKKYQTSRYEDYPRFRHSLELIEEDYEINEERWKEIQSKRKGYGIPPEILYYTPDENITIHDVIYNWIVGMKKLEDEYQGKIFAKISELYAIREYNRKLADWERESKETFIESYEYEGWATEKSLGLLIVIVRDVNEFYLGEGNHRIKWLMEQVQRGYIEDHLIPVGFSFIGEIAPLRPEFSINDLEKYKSSMIAEAQKIYDDWDENIDEYAGGGICHLIADAMLKALPINLNAATVSSSHEQHVYIVGQFREGVYSIDLPYSIYESGGGFSWKKIHDIIFEEGDIVTYRISPDFKDYDKYIAEI